jgi:hypothetical protein
MLDIIFYERISYIRIFQGDTSGNYRKILLELLKDPSQRSQKAGNGKRNYL